MTAKRFNFICDDEKCFFKDGNKALYCYEVVDLLNSLSDENEQLEEAREYYQENFLTMKTERNQFKRENELLKTQLQNTSDQRNEFHRGARENANHVGKLQKENEQLQIEKDTLKKQHTYELTKKLEYKSKLTDLKKENKQLKQELKVYHKVASCSNCKYHNYDWDIDDGYGGEEYEVCDKGNDVTEGICEEWEEL